MQVHHSNCSFKRYRLQNAGLPELDEPGWTSDDFIRDFPVDFTLVLENVGDPDHGELRLLPKGAASMHTPGSSEHMGQQ